jgi:hypothetical protein
MATEPERREDNDYLAIYLRDHLASATGGIELARRLRRNEDETAVGPRLGDILAEILQDRETLENVMAQLDISPSELKNTAAWIGEKFTRLKLNGRVMTRSPLSRIVELEGLIGGVAAKRSLWESLQALEARENLSSVDLESLIERADHQIERLRKLHREVAEQTFGEVEERAPSPPEASEGPTGSTRPR